MNKLKLNVLFLLLLLATTSDLFAVLIVPHPLRKLVIESEYIIAGYVINTSKKKMLDGEWTNRIAKIVVLGKLQSDIKKDTIEIEFNPNISCPYPDRYYDSTYVIAFLDWDKNRGKFFTHALSYEAKTLNKEELKIYKQRIFEIQQILKIPNKEKQHLETIEWLVKCAENPITRWEGIYELTRKLDSKNVNSTKLEFEINANQKERLKNVLLSLNDNVDFELVNLVYNGNEEEIDNFILQKLKSSDKADCDYFVSYLYSLKHRNKSKEMDNVMEQFNKLLIECDNPTALKKIIEKFIQLIE